MQKALAGETATAVRDAGGGRMVLSVAVPVQRYRQVLGSLFLTKPGDSIEAKVQGVTAKKFGRLWRVFLDPSWTKPAATGS